MPLKVQDISQRYGKDRKTIYDWIAKGFPRNGTEAEMDNWVASKTRARENRHAGLQKEEGATTTKADDYMVLRNRLTEAQVKNTDLKNKVLELEERQRAGELVNLSEMLDEVRSAFVPISRLLDSLPANLATKCNPQDPDLARDALELAIEGVKDNIRKKLNDLKERSMAHRDDLGSD